MRAPDQLMPAPEIITTNSDDWSRQLREAITDPSELLESLCLDANRLEIDADSDFRMRVPRAFAARMRVHDPDDPLLRQVLPLGVERAASGWVADPLAERAATIAPGIIQKYRGRALVIATGACAVHCRYCFRRAFPYDDHRLAVTAQALQALADDPSITEVILSGGDPLTLTDAHFARLVDNLGAIAHVQRVRIHTRLPIVIPDRVTPMLADTLAAARPRIVVVVHVNHANELDDPVAGALGRLTAAGITLLNQSVLLAGVNDDAGVLAALSERLFECDVLPYYLHLPDAVAGTRHFDVSEPRALELYAQLRARLPGYLVPRLAREVPGEPAKRWL
jgi:EF-P beta-lysylation protein EpmB